MPKTRIEWCDNTINPVVGCAHGCSYCYARRVNNRFKDAYPESFAEDFTKPQFFPKKMEEPYKIKKPTTFFVGSMSDPAFWSNEQWFEILFMCKRNPQHTFMFLSKDPQTAYGKFFMEEPYLKIDNIMFGATVTYEDYSASWKTILELFRFEGKVRIFLSIEPLLGVIENSNMFEGFEKVIVGAMTGPGAIKPTQEMIDSIKIIPEDRLFLKDRLLLASNENIVKLFPFSST